jgi:phage tail-like protein
MGLNEFLIGAKFYYSAEGVTDKIIQKCSQVNVNTPVGGNENPIGAGKSGDVIRQNTPTFEKFPQLEMTLVASQDDSLYKWYAAANHVLKGATKWAKPEGGRRLSWIVSYNQSGQEVIRWEFVNSYLVSYSPPMFDATTSNMATEKVKFSYEFMRRITSSQSSPQGSSVFQNGND